MTKPNPLTEEALQRFWSKVDKSAGDDACWEWTAAKNNAGRGKLKWPPKTRSMEYAYRVAYELTYGPIPKGKLCCHHCDNPGCVNPDHLFIGTHRDNMLDAKRKGRLVDPPRVRNTVLTEAQVKVIRVLLEIGQTKAEIARMYCVGETTIRNIAFGNTWQHVK